MFGRELPRRASGPGQWVAVLAAALSPLLVLSCGPAASTPPPAPVSGGPAAGSASGAASGAPAASAPAAGAPGPSAPAAQVAPPAARPEQQKVVVRMDWIPWLTHAPLHLAVEKGWFTERGLDVEIQDGNGSVVAVQVVGAGRFDIGFASLGAMIVGRDEGLPVRSIASIVRKGDLGGMYRESSGIRTPKDWEGKSLVTTPGSFEQPFIEPFLRKNGTNPDRVNIVAVDASARLQAFLAGRGEVYITAVPQQLARLNKIEPMGAIIFADYGLPLPGHGFFATDEVINAKPNMLRAFVDVAVRGWEYAREHPAEAMDIMYARRADANLADYEGELAGLEAYRAYLDSERTRGKTIGWHSEDDWADIVRTMAEAGVIKTAGRPTEYFTNDFIPNR